MSTLHTKWRKVKYKNTENTKRAAQAASGQRDLQLTPTLLNPTPSKHMTVITLNWELNT